MQPYSSIAWNSYKSGDNDIDNVEYAHATRCLMASSHTDTSIYFNIGDDELENINNRNVDWKYLYETKISRNNELGCTILNLRLEIKEYKCNDLESVVLKLWSNNVDLKKVVLWGFNKLNVFKQTLNMKKKI